MRRWLRTPPALLVWRIALLYGVMMLCRLLFLLCNLPLLRPIGWDEAGQLLRGAALFDTASVVYADGLFILLALLPLPMRMRDSRFFRNLLYGYYVVVNSLLVVVTNLADIVYFHYTQKRFTADEIFFADNSNSLQLVLKFAAENWLLVVAGAALIALLAAGYRRRAKSESLLRGWSYYAASTVIWMAAGLLCVAGMRGGITRMTRPITLSNATLYTASSEKANLILSNPFCILRTIGSSGKISYRRYFEPDELERTFTPVHDPADSAAVDLSGRNVMIFIMESMSAEHSAELRPDLYAGLPDRGYTPFLDSLMRSGLNFRQMYANGTRSIQAMPAVLGSIPSFKTPFVLMPQSLGTSRQLPAILAGHGYATAFFCGSERGSMGFGAYARSAGIERLVSREDYEAAHGTGDFDGYWGIWDEPFLQFAGEELSAMPEPFFATLFTLHAHHPFVVPEALRDSLPEGFTPNHRCVAYDDRAFRHFFGRFGNEEWFRRTIFVFVADHVSSEKFAPETKLYPGNHHIIGFLYTPDGALQGSIGEVVQQIDIMPTLLGLLGTGEPYFAYGRDILNEPDRPRWSVSYGSDFQAVTNDGILHFDEERFTFTPHETDGIIPAREPDTGEPDTALLEAQLKALIQQYYTRIERKHYTVQ